MSLKKNIIILVILILLFHIISCDTEMIKSGFPNVITSSVEDRGDVVVFSGELIQNEIAADEVGFIWQIGDDDPISRPGFELKSAVTVTGPFNAEVHFSIKKDHSYSLRAFARCGETVVYGEKMKFQSDLILPCHLEKVEPESGYRGDTVQLLGQGFNKTLSFNRVTFGGKNSTIIGGNDSVLKCIVPADLSQGQNSVTITVNGVEKNFGPKFSLLLPPPPVVVTVNSHSVTGTTAILEGTVNPNGLPCTVSFEYGTTTAYGQTSTANPGQANGITQTNVIAQLNSLLPETTYHFRIKAVSESGTGYGNDLTFRTLELPPIPIIESLSATNVKYGSILTIYGKNLGIVSQFRLGSSLQYIQVTPKTISADSVEIEVYNHQNPYQLLGFASFRIGLVYQTTTLWSDLVTIGSSWTQLADLPGQARYKAGCFSLGGQIYIGCGASPAVLKDFWRYDPSSNTWSKMADFPGEPRIYPASLANLQFGYMGSGNSADNSSRIQLLDFYKYNPTTGNWNTMPSYPDEILDFYIGYSASIKGRLFLGLSNSTNIMREIVNDSWVTRNGISNLMNNTGTASLIIGNSFYVIAGFNLDGTPSKAVWEYNIDSQTWTRKADFPGSTRHVAIGISINGYGYYGCGRGLDPYTQYKDMWRYEPATDTWIRIEDFPGGNRSHTVSASIGENGFTGLGINMQSSIYYKDFWKFSPGK